MIPLLRDRTVEAIDADFLPIKKDVHEKTLLFGRREALIGGQSQGFKSAIWKKAKEQLLAETSGKCSYCEAPTHEVAFGDVEHYRPKSTYWWLAYNYDNYLASCQLCNQKFKKAKFSTARAKLRGPVVRKNSKDQTLIGKVGSLGPDPTDQIQIEGFRSLHEQERPLLLNPYYDQPDLFYAWEADDLVREVRLAPASPGAAPFVRAAIEDFGINRPELRRSRYLQYRIYRTFRRVLDDPGMDVAIRQEVNGTVAEMESAGSPYAGMVRFFSQWATADL